MQALEDRGVGEAEQVQPGLRADRERHPGRDGDEVAAADAPLALADPHGAGAVEHLPHRGADLAAGGGGGAGAQAVHLGADGRHDVAAGGRVGEPDGRVPRLDDAGVALVLQRELRGERGVGVLPPVGRDRRARGGPGLCDRPQAGVGPEPLGAGPGGRRAVGDLVGARLEERGADVVDERDVEPVEPRHRPVGLVVVAVEPPAGGEQEVAAAHGDRVVVDDGPHALALDDEPERVLGVPVDGGVLARVEVLDRRPERRRGVGGAAEAGVGECDGAALAAAPDRYQLARALREPQQVLPAPHVRLRGRARAGRHEVADLGPQRHEQLLLEAAVELFEGGGALRLARPVDRLQRHR